VDGSASKHVVLGVCALASWYEIVSLLFSIY
jgi:hypothetical protein